MSFASAIYNPPSSDLPMLAVVIADGEVTATAVTSRRAGARWIKEQRELYDYRQLLRERYGRKDRIN